MKTLLTIVIALFLAACGSNPSKVAAVKVGDEYYKPDNAAAMDIDNNVETKLVCERRIVTGSNRKQKVCTTQAQKDADRRAAEERINQNNTRNSRAVAKERGG